MHTGMIQPVHVQKQRGLTLVELMVAITLSFLVVLASTALLVSSKVSYVAQDSSSIMQDTARYALENIARSVRQSGYEQWDRAIQEGPIVLEGRLSANLAGLDARSILNNQTPGITATAAPVNSSDVLAVRFFGSGPTGNPDGSMVDCAGFAISEPARQNTAEQDRGWSIYYVALDGDGVPELRCRRMADGGGGWTSHAIARGVESFQVLYGVDTDGDRIPNRFMTATQVNALDAGIGANNENTHWKRIAAIKVALLIHGPENAGTQGNVIFNLFGRDYANPGDAGTVIDALTLPQPHRARKIFAATIQFRNRIEGGDSREGRPGI